MNLLYKRCILGFLLPPIPKKSRTGKFTETPSIIFPRQPALHPSLRSPARHPQPRTPSLFPALPLSCSAALPSSHGCAPKASRPRSPSSLSSRRQFLSHRHDSLHHPLARRALPNKKVDLLVGDESPDPASARLDPVATRPDAPDLVAARMDARNQRGGADRELGLGGASD